MFSTPEPQPVYQYMTGVFRKANATAVIDLSSVFVAYPPHQLLASRFDSHPNELAHTLAAQALYEAILAYINNL